MDLFNIINNFRNAIDIAKENGEFNGITCFNQFPNNCCDLTCDLLAQYLFEKEITTIQVNGSSIYDESWHHVWLQTNNGIVIDITGDQFKGKIPQLKEIPKPIYVGKENELQKIFCKNRYNEKNTNFIDTNEFTNFDKQPSTRQKTLIKIYEIINRYL